MNIIKFFKKKVFPFPLFMYNYLTYVPCTVHTLSRSPTLCSPEPKGWIKTDIVKLRSVLTDVFVSSKVIICLLLLSIYQRGRQKSKTNFDILLKFIIIFAIYTIGDIQREQHMMDCIRNRCHKKSKILSNCR